MPQPSYPYACARISALEKNILSRENARRMAESSIDDVMRQLLDMRYGGLPDATPEDCERMINNERLAAAATVMELSPEPALTDLFLLQSDVHNLKVLVKARMLSSTDVAWQEGGLYDREQLQAMVDNQNYEALPKPMAEALDRMERQLLVHFEPQIVSILCDYGYLAHALEQAEQVKEPFAKQYFRALCDFNNVLTFLRMRAMGASREDLEDTLLPVGGITSAALIEAYELPADAMAKALSSSVARQAINAGLAEMLSTGNIGALEKARDDYLLGLVNDHRHDVLTIFPVVGYFLARDREAKAIRLIVTVKRNGLDDGVITERLRELYG